MERQWLRPIVQSMCVIRARRTRTRHSAYETLSKCDLLSRRIVKVHRLRCDYFCATHGMFTFFTMCAVAQCYDIIACTRRREPASLTQTRRTSPRRRLRFRLPKRRILPPRHARRHHRQSRRHRAHPRARRLESLELTRGRPWRSGRCKTHRHDRW